ncbi:MAG: rhodanese-like domain-containing protein [Pseudomonadota bacterium]
MKHFLLFLGLFLLLLSGCSNENKHNEKPAAQGQSPTAVQQQAATFRSIPVAEAKKMLESRNDIKVLDIRTPEELREGALAGSTLVPFWAIMQNKLNLPLETPIMLICAVGGRSYAAGQMLSRYGYREVYNVSGGLVAWKEAGYPVKY